MEEKTLIEALAKLKPADLQRLAPALVEGITSAVKGDAEKLTEATNAKFADLEKKVSEQAAGYEKKLAEQAVEINKLSEARAKAEKDAALLVKLNEITSGKPASEAKRNHVKLLVDLGVNVTAENVEELMTKWEAVNAPLIKILEAKDGTAPGRSEEEKALAASKEATAPKNGIAAGDDPLGLFGLALTEAPKTEGAKA